MVASTDAPPGASGAPQEHDGQAPPSDPRRKRQLLVAIALLVTLLLVYLSGAIARSAVRHQIDARLIAAGAGANAGAVLAESDQLSLLRAITFTAGIPQALATRNAASLNRLVTPLQANSSVPMVDLALPSGQVVFAVRSQGAPAPVASRRGLAALRATLADAHDARAGRFSEITTLQRAPVLLTIGPLLESNQPVGVVLTMTPLADVLGRLASEVGAELTAFLPSGVAEATTATSAAPTLDANTAQALIHAGNVAIFNEGGTRLAVGRLIVDHHAAALLAVALPDDSLVTELLVDLVAFLAACAGWLLALVLLRREGEASQPEVDPREGAAR